MFSQGIINYVARTKSYVLLGDATRQMRFQTDPYVAQRKPASILCYPLINQGKSLGVIYLENTTVANAFTPQRLETVELLCSQAAISINNAHLFSELEETNLNLEAKVMERTQDLAQKNSELEASLERQQQMQHQLLISEKMASLGNLVAGVAHEINTPIGAMVASGDTANRCSQRLQALLGAIIDDTSEHKAKVQGLFDVLHQNHRVIKEAGVRVSHIIKTLRNFARLDEAERQRVDIHQGLDSTLQLLRHRLKDSIAVIKEYGRIPPLLCYPNQLNQVFMNLLNNAIDAIRHKTGAHQTGVEQGTITIRSWQAENQAILSFSDTGSGIPESVQSKIFDPGFTTKGVGVGTGLGLSISYNIIEKHCGTITVESQLNQGTTFTITLPMA